MLPILLLLLMALPLGAQDLEVPCEASAKTLRLLEGLPLLRDPSIPYEQRVGALRALAERNPDDFFIQRAYQDSFRHAYHLGDEYDRALAMYHKRASDPLARYYEARLLMYAEPQRSRALFERLLRENPKFLWPHLEFAEWTMLPGRRDAEATTSHLKVFTAACPEAPVGGPVQDPAPQRTALERRNTWLDLSSYPQLWTAEERAGIGAETLQSHVQGDLKRIERWVFRPEPDLIFVYREAARILNDPGVIETLRARVGREAPNSLLALRLAEDKWSKENPAPASDAGQDAWNAYQEKQAKAQQEWLWRWPNALSLLSSLWHRIDLRARTGEPGVGSAEDLALVDQLLRVGQASPDAGSSWPPVETLIARFYVTARVRLDQVPGLLETGLRNIEKQLKYRTSPELFPEEMCGRVADWREMTWQQTEGIRADYFLATNRPADARALAEQALEKVNTKQPTSLAEKNRAQADRTQWIRRLANVDAQEGRVEDALAHYQASLAGVRKESLGRPSLQAMLAPIKHYYLAHGGTEEKWPDWATEKTNAGEISVGRTPPAFVTALPEFTAQDLSGRRWQLRDLTGKATLVNLWATWCGPCRGEHPSIQKLHEMLKDRKDIQVVTISVDESPGAVTAYLKEQGYTFPVIHAPELADKLFPYAGLPSNFLVNAKGVRTSLYGFGGDAASLQRLLEDLENAARERQ